MKLAKLSLAAIAVVGLSTSSFAADSLADAFKDGKVSGTLQAYYFSQDNGTADADIATFGVDLSYQTDTFNGFAFKATFQSSAAPFADEDAKTGSLVNPGPGFAGDMWGSGAQLSEAYISYAMGKTTALVGRMYLDTPLIASSGSRMNKEAFEGAAVINTDLPDTTLIVGYVQKMQTRTDGDGNFGEFTKGFVTADGYSLTLDSGAYEIAVINNSIKDVTLTAAYANVDTVEVDTVQVAYLEAAYQNGTFGVAGQYYYTDIDNLYDNYLFGVKADATFGAANVYAAYTTTGDDGEVVAGVGNGADNAFTGSPINSTSYQADEEAYKVGATYAVMANANIGASYTVNDIDATNTKNTYTAVEADYSFDGALKGLSFAFQYEVGGEDEDNDELRFKANYAF